MKTRDQILDVYGPQLGELAWHALHADSRITAMSELHAASIVNVARACQVAPDGRPIRILEVGAYAHFGAHRAAAALGGVSFAHDVSPTSLRIGLEGARAAGIGTEATLVAGDFHDLPFNTGYFDLIFCASSIHHTFRPWRVLNEMLRVLRPGGALHLENEPVGRALSFYGFRSNRAESYTPFEAELARRGSLFIFSSPFPGSRPEILFGMIENERIPLDMFIETLTDAARIAALDLVPQVSEFDQRVLALPRDAELEASLATMILTEIEAIRPLFTEKDRLLGARLPPADDVWRLCYQVAPRLRRLGTLLGDEARDEIARLFGAALKVTVVKQGAGPAAAEAFRRPLARQDAVFNDLPTLPGLRLELTAQPLPAIESGDLPALAAVYPVTDWDPYREANGVLSILNLGGCNRIVLPGLATAAILLLRFFAVETDQPYRVVLRTPERTEIAAVVVAQSESFLMRELLPAGCEGIVMETTSLAGEALTLPLHVRLGVLRLIPASADP